MSRTKGGPWRSILGYLFGLTVIVTIVYLGGTGSIQATFKPKLGVLLLCFSANFFLFLTSSIRWGYVVNAIEGRKVCSYADYFIVFISGRFFGQYISRAGGDLVLRPGLLNRMNGVSLTKGVYATFLERFLDLLFVFVLIIPAALYLFNITTEYISLLIVVVFFALLFFFLVQKNSAFVTVLKQIIFQGYLLLKRSPFLNRLAHDKYLDRINNLDNLKLFERKALLYLLSMTCIRYGFVIGRLYLLVVALGLSIPLSVLLAGIPVAQLSLILAFTPGAVGILEGGWYAVFGLAGVSEVDSAAFLIGQRFYWFIFTNAIFLISYLIFGVRRLLQFEGLGVSAKRVDE